MLSISKRLSPDGAQQKGNKSANIKTLMTGLYVWGSSLHLYKMSDSDLSRTKPPQEHWGICIIIPIPQTQNAIYLCSLHHSLCNPLVYIIKPLEKKNLLRLICERRQRLDLCLVNKHLTEESCDQLRAVRRSEDLGCQLKTKPPYYISHLAYLAHKRCHRKFRQGENQFCSLQVWTCFRWAS